MTGDNGHRKLFERGYASHLPNFIDLVCSSRSCSTVHYNISRGQVEYKARSILETLYSMRDINLILSHPQIIEIRRRHAVPTSMPKLERVEAVGAVIYYHRP